MTTGSTLVVIKKALRTALEARPGLAGVKVSYDPDLSEPEAIILGNARTIREEDIPVMKSGTAKVDERYTLDVVIQVRLEDGQDQEAADERAVAILAELQQVLAAAPQLVPEVFTVQLDGWEHFVGAFPSGRGHGSRFETKVRAYARLYPS